MVYYVYLIKTLDDYLKKSYVGYTNDLSKRINKHNNRINKHNIKNNKILNKTNLFKTNNKQSIIQSINKTVIEHKHIKKETIPKRIRELVWTTHNTEVFSNKCYVSWCNNIINVFNFQVGHDIPESKGGTLDIDNLKPIFGCDVWEHAYYVDYRNRRPDYLKAFVEKLANWEFVESQLS